MARLVSGTQLIHNILINRLLKHIIRSNWWKYLCVLTLITTSFLSLWSPLSPNILGIDNNQFEIGENTLILTGYNTLFTQGENQVWLEIDQFSICAERIEVIDEAHMKITFDIQRVLPDKKLDLVVNSAYGGMMVSPQRVWVSDANIKDIKRDNDCYIDIQDKIAVSAFAFPNKNILNETIRNLNFHVPMWFSMIFLMMLSLVASILFLRTNDQRYDIAASSAVHVGLLFAICGLATGATWARFTWGAWWTSDPQLNGAAISTLIYLAYFLLRKGIEDPDKKARIAAVYAIFAFVMFYVFVKVIPGMADFSLHPDTTDNPSFKDYDVEDRLKLVLRFSAAGWIALSFWIFTLLYRIKRVELKRFES